MNFLKALMFIRLMVRLLSALSAALDVCACVLGTTVSVWKHGYLHHICFVGFYGWCINDGRAKMMFMVLVLFAFASGFSFISGWKFRLIVVCSLSADLVRCVAG